MFSVGVVTVVFVTVLLCVLSGPQIKNAVLFIYFKVSYASAGTQEDSDCHVTN